MDAIKHIPTIPLFQGLTPEHHTHVASIVVEKVYRRNQVIFSEGDEGNGFYVVISGRVKVFKLSPDGKEQILHILGAGEPFGEVAVFAGERFPAHAEALEETRVIFFPRASFADLIKKNPSLAMNMLAVLSRRLRRFSALIEDLSLKEVPGRLSAYLLYLSDKKNRETSLTLDISKAQLASLLGTIPETISRILARMSAEELIESDGHRNIKILDRPGLEELASGERKLS
ncbi:MAG: Crp/Fnr family transcriptional regulator [Proteobacteria bacterium]|nr:Crp/Fnr family transcriptional regulator [Pseudomonadota bacterium]